MFYDGIDAIVPVLGTFHSRQISYFKSSLNVTTTGGLKVPVQISSRFHSGDPQMNYDIVKVNPRRTFILLGSRVTEADNDRSKHKYCTRYISPYLAEAFKEPICNSITSTATCVNNEICGN